ncbi:MAG TPA: putative PEP-binding protein, partial [Acidimicrobiales bacterium]|nr:putative PEP-binding protein [Acidimicrobiales bacterium]
KQDFVAILEAMDGLPVTVRLLDPPLHEFLPSISELEIKDATTGLSDEEKKLLAAARTWQEFNPMLGTRGVRLGVIKPGLYAMQVRALMQAAVDRVKDGGKPVIEIMIPLTVTREELALARGWVEDAVRETLAEGADASVRRRLQVLIGTMIETPRAALRAGEIAEVADFFSFGTNDLTQMTFGFSRDDVEGRMMSSYLEKGLLVHNPFEVVDPDGVGELVRLAVDRGRATRPSLKVGVCGEHGGDPESIATFAAAGLDYVSCSPFRVPIARLSAAQAVLAQAVPSRRPAAKAAGSKSTRSSKRALAKKAARKATAKKAAAKKAAKGTTARTRKTAARKTAKRAPAKKTAKRAPAKKTAKRAPAKKTAKRVPAAKSGRGRGAKKAVRKAGRAAARRR